MMVKLIDAYRLEITGLTSKEAKAVRVYWHAAAKRYLNMMLLTSDPFPCYPNDGSDHVRPYDGLWLNTPFGEIVEVYRATKPKRPAAS